MSIDKVLKKVKYYSYYYEDWMEIPIIWTTKLQSVTVCEYPGMKVSYVWE
jgi:hypothetical protein